MDLPSLSDIANIGSIVGAVFTAYAWYRQRQTRTHYRLLLRAPEIVDELTDLANVLNEYGAQDAQEQKTVLRRLRNTVGNALRLLTYGYRVRYIPLQASLWWYWKSATAQQVQNFYAEVQGLITDLNLQIRNKEVEQ